MLEAQAALLEPDRSPAGVAPCPEFCKRIDLELPDDRPPPTPLNISLVNVPFRAESNGFDGGVLDAFFQQREVEAAREYFYVVDGRPHLSCWIEWRERGSSATPDAPPESPPTSLAASRAKANRSRRSAEPGDDSPSPMTPNQQRGYDALRAWRLGCAKARGVPAYRVLTNRVMERIARAQPLERSQLDGIDGVGEATLETHGAEILDVLTRARAGTGEASEGSRSADATATEAIAVGAASAVAVWTDSAPPDVAASQVAASQVAASRVAASQVAPKDAAAVSPPASAPALAAVLAPELAPVPALAPASAPAPVLAPEMSAALAPRNAGG